MMIEVPDPCDQITINGIPLKPGKPHVVVRMFDDDPDSDFRSPYVGEDESDGDSSYSYLLKFGRLSEQLYILPCECIYDTAIVVPNIEKRPYKEAPKNRREENKRAKMDDLIDPLGPGFFVIKKRWRWGVFFGNLIESF